MIEIAMSPSSSASKRRTMAWIALAIVVAVIDQWTKHSIAQHFTYGERAQLLPFFDLTLLYNKGAAFSFLAGASGWQREFFTAVGVIAALFIVRLIAKNATRTLFSTALALILGGAIGNVIDRVRLGHVIDFLLLYWHDWYWPAFNVADSAIVGGAVLLILEEILRAKRAKS